MPQSQQRISYHPCVRGRVRIRDNLWWHQATNSGDCCWQHCHCRHFAAILHHITFVHVFQIYFYLYSTFNSRKFRCALPTGHWPSPSVTKVSASVWQVEVTLQLIQQDQKVNHIDPTKACYWLFDSFGANITKNVQWSQVDAGWGGQLVASPKCHWIISYSGLIVRQQTVELSSHAVQRYRKYRI